MNTFKCMCCGCACNLAHCITLLVVAKGIKTLSKCRNLSLEVEDLLWRDLACPKDLTCNIPLDKYILFLVCASAGNWLFVNNGSLLMLGKNEMKDTHFF